MKTAVVLTSLLAVLAISAQAAPAPITISDLNVTGATNADGSNVTITATIKVTDFNDRGTVTLNVKSADNLVGQVFPPEELTFVYNPPAAKPVSTDGICYWTNTSLNPYFTGEFVVTVDVVNQTDYYQDDSSTNVTVNRTIGGTLNSVKVASDASPLAFVNIDTNLVFAHSIGVNQDETGAVSTPLNLMNNTNPVYVSEEQMDFAYMDTGAYMPRETPFRFDMNLHARPTSIMGFGEITRFVWTPDVVANPAGSGHLVVDVVSCSPWRNGYETNFQAHVGCAPLFMDAEDAEMMEGLLMSTTAHYMDVSPEDDDVGIGLKVNGQTNQTSYLKALISETLLTTWGIPVDQAEELLTGWTTHYDASGESEGDTIAVTTTFTPITGGDTNYAYYSTNGDAGYLVEFTFTFYSPVAAQIGLAIISSELTGDIDGDGLADLITVIGSDWYVWYSQSGYSVKSGPSDLVVSGTPATGDIDGDGLADLIMVDGSNWHVWYSRSDYASYSVSDLGIAGTPTTGDIDGDGLADLIMVDG